MWRPDPGLAPGYHRVHIATMADKRPKRPRDLNQWAKRMVDLATGEVEEGEPADPTRAKSGAKGGAVRASRLTPEQRAEAARLAAQARWRRKT
jgi:hypothetical protein